MNSDKNDTVFYEPYPSGWYCVCRKCKWKDSSRVDTQGDLTIDQCPKCGSEMIEDHCDEVEV